MAENRKKREVLIALGANLPSPSGVPERTLADALSRLPAFGVSQVEPSRFFRTPCFPPGAGPDYVNAAARIETECDAPDVLAMLHQIESEFGRERVQRWGQRTLDLDLIAMDDVVLPDRQTYGAWHDLSLEDQGRRAPEHLILPHPRVQDRAFVLVPLADVAPHWRHPVLLQTVLEMRDALDPAVLQEVVPIEL
ncbi:MAG: 2-amino-4-hydroxy-6-hydroxymethyldihydropteridine diphosphokinase [Pseudomonadota bacterium]